MPLRLTGHVPAWPLASLSTLITAAAGELVIVHVTVSNVRGEHVARVVDDRGDVVAGGDCALVVDAHDAVAVPAHAELAGERLPDVVAAGRSRRQHAYLIGLPVGVGFGRRVGVAVDRRAAVGRAARHLEHGVRVRQRDAGRRRDRDRELRVSGTGRGQLLLDDRLPQTSKSSATGSPSSLSVAFALLPVREMTRPKPNARQLSGVGKSYDVGGQAERGEVDRDLGEVLRAA